jgi:hypothetical protein
MNSAGPDLGSIHGIIKPLLGLEAWNVKLGIGSFITMEFGDRVTINKKISRGEWYLWIYCCGWYLENPNGLFLGSEDSRKILEQEIKVLEGRRIESVIISPIGFETNFEFNGGLVLHIFPLNFFDPHEFWMLFTPIGKVLVLGPGKEWTYKFSNKVSTDNE